ncbi:MAG: aminodeoxychorismate/anthranilate synthase component II [Paracoccus sp. (in: a-proteobacteria)]|nr:aminodeoxychorismate/anthranilate synthase component II [Paracoccus sp. (in: a-proteobacteria)]
MILLIDNYDSFTWNLVHYLGEAGAEVEVRRNDQISIPDALDMGAAGIVISPGPKTPREAGICTGLIEAAAARGDLPLLGVCLGHQAIGAAFGAEIIRASRIVHGKVDAVSHDGRGVFKGLPSPLKATRYHSLAVKPASLPETLEVSATAGDGTIMGLRHRSLPIEGVQFHPESIASECGHQLIANFLSQITEPA